MNAEEPLVTICVLTYGDFPELAKRCLESIRNHCDRARYRLIVGANSVCRETESYLEELRRAGGIDRLILSEENLNKCPMMRKMFEGIETRYIWWFDDDYYITDATAFTEWLSAAETSHEKVAMWGPGATCLDPIAFWHGADAVRFVREASWYGGLTPPSWKPGGKGEFNFEGKGTGDGRWQFILGGSWLIRTSAVRALNWPDPRIIKNGDDVFLGEGVRQQGWTLGHLGFLGISEPDTKRRGDPGF